jgi:hypothetical protein
MKSFVLFLTLVSTTIAQPATEKPTTLVQQVLKGEKARTFSFPDKDGGEVVVTLEKGNVLKFEVHNFIFNLVGIWLVKGGTEMTKPEILGREQYFFEKEKMVPWTVWQQGEKDNLEIANDDIKPKGRVIVTFSPSGEEAKKLIEQFNRMFEWWVKPKL